MTTTQFRSPGALPYLLAATKEGMIRRLPYGDGINGLVEMHRGEPRLSRDAEDRGFALLEDLYALDTRPKVKASGFQTYMQWNAAADRKQAKRKSVGKRGDADRMATEQLPDKWLPEELMRRRSGDSSVSAEVWEPPELDEPATPKPSSEAVTAEIEAKSAKSKKRAS